MANIYSDCIVNRALSSNKPLKVVQRWLRMRYRMNIDRASLHLRKQMLTGNVQRAFTPVRAAV